MQKRNWRRRTALAVLVGRRMRVRVEGANEAGVFAREVVPTAATVQQKPGRPLPPAVLAVLEDNIGELVEVGQSDEPTVHMNDDLHMCTAQ